MILIKGGAGFIGANFVLDWLAQSNEAVINLDVLNYAGNCENLASLVGDERHVFVQGDIGNSTLVTSLLVQYQPRAILHFAAESHVGRSIHGPEDFIRTNIVGTFRLLEAVRAHWNNLRGEAKQNFRFLHVSTDEVYGSLAKDAPAFNETNRYEPNSPYSATKATSDHLVRAYHHTYGLPVLTTNCSNNYGPYQFPEKLIPLMIVNALVGKPLLVYGDGQQIRDWLYVKDHCSAIHRVLEAGKVGEVYNIGWNEKTNIDIVHKVCALLDELRPRADSKSYREQIAYVAYRPGHVQRACRMKILLFGKGGQVGGELQRSLAPLGELVALDADSQDLCGDFTGLDGIAQTVRAVAPNIIVNAAAYTAVDKAESETELARTINAPTSSILAQEALRCGAWLIHYFTDYVFDGSGDKPWKETGPTGPLGVYGNTKLEGEEAMHVTGCQHLIFRTGWVYASRRQLYKNYTEAGSRARSPHRHRGQDRRAHRRRSSGGCNRSRHLRVMQRLVA